MEACLCTSYGVSALNANIACDEEKMVGAMSEDYFTRALTPDDWQEFAAIRLEALQKYPQFFGATYAEESAYTQEQWRDFLGKEGRYFFGLYTDKSFIGITGVVQGKLDPTGATGLMVASYIKQEYQGNRLAEKLYAARIVAALDHLQWKKLVIGHREGNEPSRRANQKWGFCFTHKESRTWPDGTIADDYHYELDLEELRSNDSHPIHRQLNEHRN